jgi:hypothetical protein
VAAVSSQRTDQPSDALREMLQESGAVGLEGPVSKVSWLQTLFLDVYLCFLRVCGGGGGISCKR